MKKHMLSLRIMMLCLLLLPATVNAASAKSKAKKEYKTFIAHKNCDYKIVDVDGNGIPELLMKYRGLNLVYGYNKKQGKMVQLISSDSGRYQDSTASIFYSKKYHKVGISCGYFGGQEIKFYKISGKKAKLKSTYESYRGSYTINGSSVSEDTFNSKLNTNSYKTISGDKVN